jgi:hypothetical protein
VVVVVVMVVVVVVLLIGMRTAGPSPRNHTEAGLEGLVSELYPPLLAPLLFDFVQHGR